MASDNAKTALLCAYTLACAKQYAKAEGLILSDTELAKTPEAMDLLARIRVEQGDIAEARRLWQEIQSLHPEHRPSHLALRNLDKPPRKQRSRTWAIIGGVVVLLIGFLLGAFFMHREPDRIVTFDWPNLPNMQALRQLEQYRGQVVRITLGSEYLSDPKRSAHRAVLTDMVSQALGVKPECVFLAQAPEGLPAGAIRVELYRR